MSAKSIGSRKFYVCSTPQPTALANAAAFAALAWVEVTGVGAMGETGAKTNILTYDQWGTDVVDKSKGMTDAGDPTLETARDATDAGQIIMRAAGLTRYTYAFKVEFDDKPSDGYSNTIAYYRGLVTGPTRPNGRTEDFDLEVYTLGLKQREIVVDPAAV